MANVIQINELMMQSTWIWRYQIQIMTSNISRLSLKTKRARALRLIALRTPG